MLKLFVNIKDQRLKIRPVMEGESFTAPVLWGALEFEYTSSSDFMMIWTSLLPDLSSQDAHTLIDFVSARFPVSPHYLRLKNLCPEVVFPDQSNLEWVFYGGTFRPWHQGHQACLDLLPKNLSCFVIPDLNPFKEHQDLEMIPLLLELNTKIRFAANHHLVPTFLQENTKNPTVLWVERLRSEHPLSQISLLLGFDSFHSIHSWTRSMDLLAQVNKLYVVSRLETDDARSKQLQKIQKLSRHLEIIFLGHHAYEGISSSELRKK